MPKKTEVPEPIKRLVFIGNAQKALQRFPTIVRDVAGQAIRNAQHGAKHPSAKPMKGFGGASVVEIVSRVSDGTYRIVYTTVIAEFVIILHAFQKKSKRGIATPKQELDLIKSRLKEAKDRYK